MLNLVRLRRSVAVRLVAASTILITAFAVSSAVQDTAFRVACLLGVATVVLSVLLADPMQRAARRWCKGPTLAEARDVALARRHRLRSHA